MRQKFLTLLVGMALGAALFSGPAAHAAVEQLTATRSTSPIYVDGQRVELEAYEINGYNYVKLRDIGQAVNFNVYWDGNAAQVESGKPYTGEPPVKEEAPMPEGQNHSAQPNPDIFTGELTREVYDVIRDTVVRWEEVLSGTYTPIQADSEGERRDLMDRVTCKLGNYPVYEVIAPEAGKLAVNVKCTAAYDAAAEHTQPFLDSLTGLSDRETVRELAWYVCDRMTYSTAITSPTKILASDGVTAGNCMAYAHSFLFLCQRAGVPCILVCSETHQWNMVYVDGTWWDVDVGMTDAWDPWIRVDAPLLVSPSERMGAEFADRDPVITRFAQELLVPGSTSSK